MKKEEEILLKISDIEAKELNKMGIPYGEGGISHTYTRKKHYFLCEAKKNLEMLSKLRQKNIVKTVE